MWPTGSVFSIPVHAFSDTGFSAARDRPDRCGTPRRGRDRLAAVAMSIDPTMASVCKSRFSHRIQAVAGRRAAR